MTGLPLVSCPSCHVEAGLEAFLGADDARGVVALMARAPGSPALRKALLRYVGLHAPAKRRITWDRAEKLLAEVIEMMESGRVERGGRSLPAPLDYWLHGLDAIFAMPALRRPLKGHGLLLEIISGLSGRTEAKQEQQRLTQGRGETPVGGSPLSKRGARGDLAPAERTDVPKKPTHNPEAAAKAIAKAKSILKGA